MTGRIMVDTTDWKALPAWAAIRCYYSNGRYAAPLTVINAFKGPKVTINVTGDPTDDGDVLDVENGDATPDDVAAWFDARTAAGQRDLGVYCDRDSWDAVTAALASRKARRWLATLDCTLLTEFNGVKVDACQFIGQAQLRLPLDISFNFSDDWHPSSSPAVPTVLINNLVHALENARAEIGDAFDIVHDITSKAA
jgi:hypothetical protein